MSEVLPRIHLFCRDPRFTDIPIIVNSGLHENLMNSLFLVCGDRLIYTLPTYGSVQVDHLYITSPSGYVPFDQRRGENGKHSHGKFSPEAIRLLCDHLMKPAPRVVERNWPERIYLHRSSSIRRIINNDALERIAREAGYTILSPEKLSFSEQIEYFKCAKHVISATGAACANAIFMPEGSRLTVLMGEHPKMIYRYWQSMVQPLGIAVDVICGPIVEQANLGIHGSITIDPELFGHEVIAV